MLDLCRVCSAKLNVSFVLSKSTSLSSVLGNIEAPTVVRVCDSCSHAQTESLSNVADYYDSQYRISLDNEHHDQLLTSTDLKITAYRTEYQARICLEMCEVPENANVIDFGAAQARSLFWLASQRPDIVPHVFDVSEDYRKSWDKWLPSEQQATYQLPDDWHGKFDLVTSYFVLEHVEDPVGYLKLLASCVKPDGKILISLPDVDLNPGDMIVADHLNHFSSQSLITALNLAGIKALKIINDSLLSSFFVLAEIGSGSFLKEDLTKEAYERNVEISKFWQDAVEKLKINSQLQSNKVCAIYGAGFYGSWIKGQIESNCQLVAFVDMNEKLQSKQHLGLPIVSPSDLPLEVEIIFVGLNPLKARQIIANVIQLQGRALEFIWLD